MIPEIQSIDRELFYREHERTSITGTCAIKMFYGDIRISVAPKLQPIFNGELDQCEFILLEGGRGGAKSESVAEKLILIAREEVTRILCTREIQNTINDSVKKVIESWIEFLGFSNEFHITKTSITHKKTGTDFIFMGMKAGTEKDSMKSLKGVKYVWVEEAQTLSQESQEILEPTIRINGRQFYYTYNPRTKQDTVNSIKNRRKSALIIINYKDNPWLPQTMLDSAEEMKVLDYDRYLHVWMGQPMAEDAGSIVLPYSQLSKCIDLHKAYGFADGHMFGGFDIADGQHDYNDKNSFACRQGPAVKVLDEWRIEQVYQSVSKVHNYYYQYGFSEVNYDVTGLGVAAKSEYARWEKEEKKVIPYDIIPFIAGGSPMGKDTVYVKHGPNMVTNGQYFKNTKSQLWWNGRLRLANSMKLLDGKSIDREDYYLSFSSKISDLDSLFMELSQGTYATDSAGRILIDKCPGVNEIQVDGKKKVIRSPNKADSTLLSYAADLKNGLRAHSEECLELKNEEEEYAMPMSWEGI